MTARTRLIVLVISAPVIAFAVIGGFLGNVMARADDTYAHLKVFQDVVSLIMSNYVEQPNLDTVMRGAKVDRGQTLGTTGRILIGMPGTYFEMRVDGKPVDPLEWLKKRT